jgi:hypothetical protein
VGIPNNVSIVVLVIIKTRIGRSIMKEGSFARAARGNNSRPYFQDMEMIAIHPALKFLENVASIREIVP